MTIDFPPPPQGASNAVRAGTGFKQWFLDVWAGMNLLKDAVTANQASLANLGKWSTYTPTLTGLTLGTTGAVNSGRYTKIGTTVIVNIQIVIGTGGSVTSLIYLGLPVTARAGYSGGTAGAAALGQWRAIDASGSGNTSRPGGLVGLQAIDQVRFWGVDGSVVNNTTPWTWAVGDILEAEFTYEAAA